jgi:hypothetical protein
LAFRTRCRRAVCGWVGAFLSGCLPDMHCFHFRPLAPLAW